MWTTKTRGGRRETNLIIIVIIVLYVECNWMWFRSICQVYMARCSANYVSQTAAAPLFIAKLPTNATNMDGIRMESWQWQCNVSAAIASPNTYYVPPMPSTADNEICFSFVFTFTIYLAHGRSSSFSFSFAAAACNLRCMFGGAEWKLHDRSNGWTV